MRGIGEKVFGILAIVVGIGIAVAAAAGVTFGPVVLLLISMMVIGWVAYYWVVIRPAPTSVERPDRSPRHDLE
jgi:hypothetical protein